MLVAIVTSSSLAVAAPRLELAQDVVGQFCKVDLTIRLDRSYENPFDPRQVSVDIELVGPRGETLSVPAFFAQDYERRNVPRGGKQIAWFYPIGQAGWKARFAPSVVGTWTAKARVVDRDGQQVSNSVSFACGPSDRKGYLRLGEQDPRYLQFTTGEPFFAIGQNLAFIGEGQQIDVAKAEAIFGKLNESGANWLRIWTCCQDWAIAIEARKSAWDRSWGDKAALAFLPGDEDKPGARRCIKLEGDRGKSVTASPSHPVAVKPATKYVLTAQLKPDGKAALRVEVNNTSTVAGRPGVPLADDDKKPAGAEPRAERGWTTLRHEFPTAKNQYWLDHVRLTLDAPGEVFVDRLSLKEDRPDAAELFWESDPNRPLPGAYNLLDAAMIDTLVAAAETHGLYLQLCVVTRDLYMKHLKDPKSPEYDKAIADVQNLMRYCVARWGHSTHVAAWEYFNEIDPGLPTDRFYTEVGEYLEKVDPYRHLRTTSTWAPSKKDCRHPKLDIAQVHHYLRPTLGDAGKDEAAAIFKLAEFLREHGPNKPGMIAEFGLADDKWGLSPSMKQDEKLEHFHNSLWASALSGTASTAQFWWWERLEVQNAYPHYRPLAQFLAGVPFGKEQVTPFVAKTNSDKVRALGLRYNRGERRLARLWVFNSAAAWNSTVVEKKNPEPIKGLEIWIDEMPETDYQFSFVDTRTGQGFDTFRTRGHTGRVVHLRVPAFDRDIAVLVDVP